MKNYRAKEVDEYIAYAPEVARPHLAELRNIITSAIPNVEEKISWGVPWYRYHGMLAGFAAFKNHICFGPVWQVPLDNKVRKKLLEKGYKTGKKTIQIRYDQPVPATVITKMLKRQVKMNEAKKKDEL